ncbi:hypothetical protein BJ165DRAFT_1392651 [Panaeolus papilionaceus]|nr:hypothetical protein BJ165DRAFT_1392651 [Panaeolus papilionaceus]
MPWVKNQPKRSIKADPACVENAKILRLLSIDIGFVLNELRHDSTPTKPSGFPYSEWSNILKGNPINLDKVLSSLHRVHAPKESTGCLGDVEISIGHSKPSRRIRNQSEWSSSWNRAIRAYVFIFPHRRDELVEYGEWIEQQFESLVEVSAGKVITLDKCIRDQVEGGSCFRLNDFNRWSRFERATLFTDGSFQQRSNTGSSRTGKTSRNQPSAVCDKFNQRGGCQRSPCRYLHQCRQCGKEGHGRFTCREAGGDRT